MLYPFLLMSFNAVWRPSLRFFLGTNPQLLHEIHLVKAISLFGNFAVEHTNDGGAIRAHCVACSTIPKNTPV